MLPMTSWVAVDQHRHALIADQVCPLTIAAHRQLGEKSGDVADLVRGGDGGRPGVDDVEHRAEVGPCATHVGGGAVRAERDIPNRRSDFDGASTRFCAGCRSRPALRRMRRWPRRTAGDPPGSPARSRRWWQRMAAMPMASSVPVWVSRIATSAPSTSVRPAYRCRPFGLTARSVTLNASGYSATISSDSVSKASTESCSADTLLT